ncbi:Glucose-fructose oxidoreductase domain-containing protein 1 [Mactra antiquata]
MRKMLPGIGVFGTTPSIRSFVAIFKSCGFRVVALWGRVKAEAEQLASELDIAVFTDNVDEILLNKDVDVIVISCPPHMQSPIAVKALGIGKHVFCGTPAGPTQVESLKMVHAAGYYPKLAARMIYGLRFLPTIKNMKQLIDDGYLGDLKICEIRVHFWNYPKDKYDWTCDGIMGGGILNSIGSNLIDIVTYLTSQRAISVHGMLKTYTKQTEKIKGIREITSEDFCSFQLELDYGACASVTINSHMPGQFYQEIVIVGTKARLTAKGADLYGQKNDSRKEELLHFDPINFKEEDRYGVSEKTKSVIPTPYLKGIIRMIESVKEAFDKEEERQSYCQATLENAATFEDSLYVQTVIDALKLSNRSKEWVKVEVKADELSPSPILPHSSASNKSL